ncbi:lipoprotein [Streptomyces olivaceus]|nr:lipoprotein [Streptomyces olivaceus]
MLRVLKAVVPVLALVVTAGCSSSEGGDEQRLTAQRENYCTQLGAWQKARNAAGTGTPESSGYDEVGAVAQDAFLAVRPLRDETVDGGRTLAEATVAAMNNSDSEAERRVVQYCDDAGFETLTR